MAAVVFIRYPSSFATIPCWLSDIFSSSYFVDFCQLCSFVCSTNLVFLVFLARFHALEANETERYVILDGAQLTEALSSWTVFDHPGKLDLPIPDNINILQDQMQVINVYKDQLHSVSSKLLLCRSALAERIVLLQSVLRNDAEFQLKNFTENIHCTATQVNHFYYGSNYCTREKISRAMRIAFRLLFTQV